MLMLSGDVPKPAGWMLQSSASPSRSVPGHAVLIHLSRLVERLKKPKHTFQASRDDRLITGFVPCRKDATSKRKSSLLSRIIHSSTAVDIEINPDGNRSCTALYGIIQQEFRRRGETRESSVRELHGETA